MSYPPQFLTHRGTWTTYVHRFHKESDVYESFAEARCAYLRGAMNDRNVFLTDSYGAILKSEYEKHVREFPEFFI